MAGHYCMIGSGAVVSYASGMDAVAAELLEIRPTIVCAVPRLYEKIYARIVEAASASPVRQRLFEWAKAAGERWADRTIAGARVGSALALRHRLADRLVFARLRARTGGRIRFFVAGGAPLAPEIARFFYAAGMPVLEGYGLTETSPVITVNTPSRLRIGSVGRPVAGVEIRIAPDGEILTRGPHVMKGYFHKPEATAEAIDPDGWFHTGDIGELDREGFLRITDRKKDIIVTAGGKNIAPQPIENLVKASPWVANAVMLGDRRKFPVLLVVPNHSTVRAWAAARDVPADDLHALVKRRDLVETVEREVMSRLAGLAHFELPKRVMILPEDFSIEGGELTPTLKVRRRVVERNYRAELDELYERPKPGE
jgi:long-chain acyl-CoA synthetase